MLSKLAKSDNLDKKWPKEKLLLALGFPVRARNVLVGAYFRKKEEISLKVTEVGT